MAAGTKPRRKAAAALTRPAGARERTRLSSVANALRLLKLFSDRDFEIGISDLARRAGLAKSTVHRLAATLVHEGMLEQTASDGKYRLGLALFELGALVRRKMDVTAEARPYLKALSERCGETVQLAVLDRHAVLYINVIESQRAIRMSYQVGTRAPLHTTAVGKVLLAFAAPALAEAALARSAQDWPEVPPGDAKRLRQELIGVNQRGYAMENEEVEAGVRGVAAPVRDFSGEVTAAVGISGPAHRLSRKTLNELARELLEVTASISHRLGYQPLPLARRA